MHDIDNCKVQMEVLNRHYRIVTQDTFQGKATQSLPDINIAQISVEYQGFRRQMFLMRYNDILII